MKSNKVMNNIEITYKHPYVKYQESIQYREWTDHVKEMLIYPNGETIYITNIGHIVKENNVISIKEL